MFTRSAPRLLLAASALFFGAAYFTVRFPEVPGSSVGSFVSTLLIALPSFIALKRFLAFKRAALSLLALSVLGFAIETTGVATGFPYGPFYYGESLGPKFADLVPYLLPLSWVPLVLGAVAAMAPRRTRESRFAIRDSYSSLLPTPDSLLPGAKRPRAKLLLSAVVLLTLVDGVLDPGATSLGFWVWPEGGSYYGVPITNYLGWLFSSSLAVALLIALGRCRWESVPPSPGLLDSAIISAAFWTGVDAISGLLFPAVLGAVLYLLLLSRRIQLAAGGGSRYKGGGEDDERGLKV